MLGINGTILLKAAFLTVIWLVLREDFNILDVVLGFVISIGCLLYSNRFLPIKKIGNVNVLKLVSYFLYLIGQIYVSGYVVIKMILKGNVRADIVKTETVLKSEVLRVILVDSVAITPGSIPIHIEDDTLDVLVLKSAESPVELVDTDDSIKGKLEARLLKIQS
ncbi:MAG: Na+/H+ antiporter subunit E [Turicibacter sp.]|nr:Na+/H+ antiporter subunit E [Turicibacter sp.]